MRIARVFGLFALAMLSYACTKPVAGSLGTGTTPSPGTPNFQWIGGVQAVVSGWSTGHTAQGPWLVDLDGQFAFPNGVAVDPTNGNIYGVDTSMSRIMKFTAAGEFAGSIGYSQFSVGTCPVFAVATGWCTGGYWGNWNGSLGGFGNPAAIAIDPVGGFLYVADTSNARVVKVNASTGASVSVIGSAGSSDGKFSNPSGIVVDSTNGFLYVADTGNNRIEKFTLSSGTFVGSIGKTTATSGSCPASGAATAWCIGGTFASGAGDGMFNSPQNIGVDSTSGFLFVADANNNRIMKINSSTGAFVGAIGKVTATSGSCPASGVAAGWCTGGTFASGAGDGMFHSPAGVAVDVTNGFLFVSDGNNPRLEKFNLTSGAFIGAVGDLSATIGSCPASGAATGWCTGGTFTSGGGDGMLSGAAQLALDSSGNVYAMDTGNRIIEKFQGGSGAYVGALGEVVVTEPTGWTSTTTTKQAIQGYDDGENVWTASVAADALNGFLYVNDSQRIEKFNLKTGAIVGTIGRLTASTGTCPASGAAPGWCTGGSYTRGTTDGTFNLANSMTVDPSGAFLYVVDANLNEVMKINASTGAFVGAIGKTSATTGSCPASGVAPGWCTGGTFTDSTADGGLDNPLDVKVDAVHGFLYVGDNYRVQKFNLATGAFVGAIGKTSATSGTCPASGAATGWCTGGTFVSSAIDGGFNNAVGLGVDPVNGFLYVMDYHNERVTKHNLSTGAFVGAVGVTSATSGTCPASGATTGWCTGGTFANTSADGGFGGAWSNVEIDVANDRFYVGDMGNGRIVAFTLSTGVFYGALGAFTTSTGTCPTNTYTTTWCTGGNPQMVNGFDGSFIWPGYVSIDGAGYLYISDSQDYRTVRYKLP